MFNLKKPAKAKPAKAKPGKDYPAQDQSIKGYPVNDNGAGHTYAPAKPGADYSTNTQQMPGGIAELMTIANKSASEALRNARVAAVGVPPKNNARQQQGFKMR